MTITATSAPALDFDMLQQALLSARNDLHLDEKHAQSLMVQIAYLSAHRLSRSSSNLLDRDPEAVAAVSSILSGQQIRWTHLNRARDYADACERLAKDFVYSYELDPTNSTKIAAFFKLRFALEDQSRAATRHYFELLRSRPADDPQVLAHKLALNTYDDERFDGPDKDADTGESAVTQDYASQVHAVIRTALKSTRLTRELTDLLTSHGYTLSRGWRWGRGGSFSRLGTVSVYHDTSVAAVYSTHWDTGAKHLPPVSFRCGKPHHQAVLRSLYFALMDARRAGRQVDLSCFVGEVG